jgi:hypothetical protein
MQWLKYVSFRDQINIQHEKNGGEFRVPGTNYTVDGVCHEKKIIYEYQGD